MTYEIERKWLLFKEGKSFINRSFLKKTPLKNVSAPPDLLDFINHNSNIIEQHYLPKNSVADYLKKLPHVYHEFRVRCLKPRNLPQKNYEYFFTAKSSGSKIRKEHEISISKSEFERLKAFSIGQVSKRRYSFNFNGLHCDLDYFPKMDFVTLEIEFKDLSSSRHFSEKPGLEITGLNKYKNKNLSRS